MKESEYTRVSNLQNIRAVIDIMRRIHPGDNPNTYGITEAEKLAITRVLGLAEQRLERYVRTTED